MVDQTAEQASAGTGTAGSQSDAVQALSSAAATLSAVASSLSEQINKFNNVINDMESRIRQTSSTVDDNVSDAMLVRSAIDPGLGMRSSQNVNDQIITNLVTSAHQLTLSAIEHHKAMNVRSEALTDQLMGHRDRSWADERDHYRAQNPEVPGRAAKA